MNYQLNKENKNHRSNFATRNFFWRVLTSLLLGGATLWFFITQSPFIAYFIASLFFLLVAEWIALVLKSPQHHKERLFWLVFGILYLLLGILGIYHLYTFSPIIGVGLLIVVWSTDIGAYFAGKMIGGKKLAPTISPGKTWAGVYGGILCAGIGAIFVSFYLYGNLRLPFVAFFLLCSFLGQIGDLLESGVKRYFKVKDSGFILPGHGGMIDRLDSLLFIGIFLFMLSLVADFSQIFNPA